MNAAQLHEHWRVLSRAADDAELAVLVAQQEIDDAIVERDELMRQIERWNALIDDLQDAADGARNAAADAWDAADAAWDAYQAAD